jgi:hypothetical protein
VSAWVGLLAALITAGATLAGVRLAQQQAATLKLLDLQEQRVAEQRLAVAEVLITGRDWLTSIERLAASASRRAAAFRDGMNVQLEAVKRVLMDASESHGKEEVERFEQFDFAKGRLERGLVIADLTVREAAMSDKVTELTTQVVMLAKLIEERHRNRWDRHEFNALDDEYFRARVKACREALRDLEGSARERLAGRQRSPRGVTFRRRPG